MAEKVITTGMLLRYPEAVDAMIHDAEQGIITLIRDGKTTIAACVPSDWYQDVTKITPPPE